MASSSARGVIFVHGREREASAPAGLDRCAFARDLGGMLITTLACALIALGPPLQEQVAQKGEAPAPVETLKHEGVRPLARVGRLLLAGQPSLDAFLELAEKGVTKVVDLRLPSEGRGFEEDVLLEELGLEYITLPFGGSTPLTDAIFDEVRSVLGEHRASGEGDLLVHCAGAVRVGAVWLPSRVMDEGVDLATALGEARTAGLNSSKLEAAAVAYVRGGGSQALGEIALEIESKLPGVARLRVDELDVRLKKKHKPLLLDARAVEEYAMSHLPGAVRASTLEEALAALDGVSKEREIVTYCSVGWRSGYLAKELGGQGFTGVKNLEGSIFAWANSGRPVYRGEKRAQTVHPFDVKWGKLLAPELRAELDE